MGAVVILSGGRAILPLLRLPRALAGSGRHRREGQWLRLDPGTDVVVAARAQLVELDQNSGMSKRFGSAMRRKKWPTPAAPYR